MLQKLEATEGTKFTKPRASTLADLCTWSNLNYSSRLLSYFGCIFAVFGMVHNVFKILQGFDPVRAGRAGVGPGLGPGEGVGVGRIPRSGRLEQGSEGRAGRLLAREGQGLRGRRDPRQEQVL